MMTERAHIQGGERPYVIHSDEEPLRLERQAKMAGLETHLSHIPARADARILDVGCGSGAMARLLARWRPNGHVTGLDLRPEYLDFATRMAANEGIRNLEFVPGNVLELPFPDESFDVVWCKYVLQWFDDLVEPVAEMRRVTRPGGYVICCNYDGCLVKNYPIDLELQRDLDLVIPQLSDVYVGRKSYAALRDAGLIESELVTESDRVWSVIGRISAEQRANLVSLYDVVFPYVAQMLGGDDRAREFVSRHFSYLEREDTFSPCTLYVVRGRAR